MNLETVASSIVELLFAQKSSGVFPDYEDDHKAFFGSVVTDRKPFVVIKLQDYLSEFDDRVDRIIYIQSVDFLIERLEGFVEPLIDAYYKEVNSRLRVNKSTDKYAMRIFVERLNNGLLHKIVESDAYINELIHKSVNNWLRNLKDLLKSLLKDENELSREIGIFNKVVLVEFGLSDLHKNQQSVAILELDSGVRMVYKPRSLGVEKAFYDWLSVAEQELRAGFYLPWIVTKEDYGWMEYVPPARNLSIDSHRYAKQLGILSVIWYMFGGSDLHDENVIFSEKGVVICDCETIFETDLYYERLGAINIAKPHGEPDFAAHSVISCGMYSVVMSNLDQKNEALLQRSAVSFLKSSLTENYEQNTKLVFTDHSQVRWTGVVATICEGVEQAYKWFASKKESALRESLSSHFKGKKARTIIRPTASYVMLLRNIQTRFSMHSDLTVLRKYIRQNLDTMPVSPIYKDDLDYTQENEIEELLNGDIPYVERTICGENSLTNNDTFMSMHFRLKWAKNNNFVRNETKFIQVLLLPEEYAKRATEIKSIGSNYSEYHEKTYDVLAYLRRIANGENLNSIIEELQHIGVARYSGAEHVEGNHYLACHGGDLDFCIPMSGSYSLFDGVSGDIFVQRLRQHARNPLQELSYIKQLVSQFRSDWYIKNHASTGPVSGLKSLLYADRLLFDPTIAQRILLQKNTGNRKHDLLYGYPSNLLLMLKYKELLNSSQLVEARDELVLIMKDLLQRWQKLSSNQKIGLAHGALGICLAAARYQTVFKVSDDELKKMTLSILKNEKAETAGKDTGNSWCYGDAGRALTYHYVGIAFDEPQYTKRALKLMDISKNISFSKHTLCCGSLGYYSVFLIVHSDDEIMKNKKVRTQMLQKFCKKILENDQENSQTQITNSLFYGIVGLEYVLLQTLNPSNVPDVLSFS